MKETSECKKIPRNKVIDGALSRERFRVGFNDVGSSIQWFSFAFYSV